MQEDFEKHLRENSEAFDRKELVGDHHKRFEERLVAKRTKRLWGVPGRSLSIAATLVIIAVAGMIWKASTRVEPSVVVVEIESKSLKDVSTEMGEVEVFLANSISNRVNYLRKTYRHDNEHVLSCMTIINSLETNYNELKLELAKSPNAKMVVDAMIVNYQTRLDILEMLIGQLQNGQEDLNTKENDTNEIAL